MPAPLDSLKSTWKNCIANNAFGQLFSEMNAQLNKSCSNYNTYISIQGRYHDAYSSEMQGAISYENAQVTYGQTKKSLLQLIDLLTPEDLAPNSTNSEDLLDALARALEVKIPLLPKHLVNCDRKPAVKSFRRSFGSWKEKARAFQFYFILACPTQEPEGFTERAIYEIMGEEEDQHQALFNYPRQENGRVRIERLPLGFTTQDSKEAFKKYFSNRFTLGNTSFEDYLRTGLPNLNWEYIATTLSITAQDWDAEVVVDYLQWLMDSFSTVETRTSNFLFFFVIPLKNAHEPAKIRRDDLETLKSIEQLVEKNADCATLIAALPPVEAVEFEYWLEDLAEAPQTKKDEIIQTIVGRLSPEEKVQFEDTNKDKPLNMEHIEDFQARVYKFHK